MSFNKPFFDSLLSDDSSSHSHFKKDNCKKGNVNHTFLSKKCKRDVDDSCTLNSKTHQTLSLKLTKSGFSDNEDNTQVKKKKKDIKKKDDSESEEEEEKPKKKAVIKKKDISESDSNSESEEEKPKKKAIIKKKDISESDSNSEEEKPKKKAIKKKKDISESDSESDSEEEKPKKKAVIKKKDISESDSDSDSEEEKPKKKAVIKKKDISESDSESDSEEEKPKKKAVIKKKDISESDSESDSEEEKPKKKAVIKKKDISESDSESDSEEEKPKKKAVIKKKDISESDSDSDSNSESEEKKPKKKAIKKKKDDSDSDSESDSDSDSNSEESKNKRKKSKEEPAKPTPKEEENKNNQPMHSKGTWNELFIKNLSYSTTKESLKEYFSKYGEVEETKIVYDSKTGRSKGVGFCRFVAAESADKAMADASNLSLDNRPLAIKYSNEKPAKKEQKQKIQQFKPNPDFEGERFGIFVGNMNFRTTVDGLQETFKDCGDIVDIRISLGADSRPRGFAHIDFASKEAQDKAVKKNGLNLDGRLLRVDISENKPPKTKLKHNENCNDYINRAKKKGFISKEDNKNKVTLFNDEDD